jgi:membrane-associated protease RseP (regulator of RpoE activity)
MGRVVLAVLVAILAGCASSLYQQWGKQLDDLTRTSRRVDDVSMLLGSPPTRCDAVTASSPSMGASIDRQKLVVNSVIPGGPAEQAGLRPGDTITSIAGQRVTTPEQARSAFTSSARAGQTLELGTSRGNVSVLPKMPKLEQCYWDVQADQVSSSAAYVSPSSGYAGGSSNQRFFRASCRVSDGFLSGCQWNYQQ